MGRYEFHCVPSPFPRLAVLPPQPPATRLASCQLPPNARHKGLRAERLRQPGPGGLSGSFNQPYKGHSWAAAGATLPASDGPMAVGELPWVVVFVIGPAWVYRPPHCTDRRQASAEWSHLRVLSSCTWLLVGLVMLSGEISWAYGA